MRNAMTHPQRCASHRQRVTLARWDSVTVYFGNHEGLAMYDGFRFGRRFLASPASLNVQAHQLTSHTEGKRVHMMDPRLRRLGKHPSTLFLAAVFAAPLIVPCLLWICFAANLDGVALAGLLLTQILLTVSYGRSISHWKTSAFNVAHRGRLVARED